MSCLSRDRTVSQLSWSLPRRTTDMRVTMGVTILDTITAPDTTATTLLVAAATSATRIGTSSPPVRPGPPVRRSWMARTATLEGSTSVARRTPRESTGGSPQTHSSTETQSSVSNERLLLHNIPSAISIQNGDLKRKTSIPFTHTVVSLPYYPIQLKEKIISKLLQRSKVVYLRCQKVRQYCKPYLKYWPQGINGPRNPSRGKKIQCFIKWKGPLVSGGVYQRFHNIYFLIKLIWAHQ